MRKVLVSLLVVAMVLGLVGTAFAGFSDVKNNKYIDKAASFDWLKGYPDGTFKPEGNITRAEAATVVVRALGLEAAADAAKGLGSKFDDVPGTHWASGYINVCTTKNILKGYPDGTFKPEANVTNAEIITMIVRALNRESEAIGDWPIGHITVAAANSIIGAGFASSTPATRGDVATYVAKASDVKFLKLTSNGWEEDTKTMAQQNSLNFLKDYKVDATDAEGKTITLTGGSPIVTKAYNLAAGFAIGDGKSLRDIEGYVVDAYTNEDNEAVFVQTVSAATTKSGTIRSLGGSGVAAAPYFFYLEGDSKKYELAVAPAAKVYRNGEEIALASFTSIFKVDDTVNFSMEGNYVSVAKATRNDYSDAVIESVRSTGDLAAQYVRFNHRGTTYTKYMTYNTTVTLDGNTSSLGNLKKNMIVNIQLDPNDNTRAMAVTASSKTVAGKVTAKRNYVDPAGDPYWYVSIDGVEYRIGGSARIYDSTYVAGSNAGTDVVYAAITIGDNITAYLAVNGRVNMADVATSTASYGKLRSITVGGDYDKWTVDVKGTDVVYEVDDKTPPLNAGTAKPGDYIFMKRNSSGRLIGGAGGTDNALPLVAPAQAAHGAAPVYGDLVTDVYSGDKLIEVNGTTWLSIGDSSVIYVDGEYGSVSAIGKDSRIRWYAASGMKITFAVVDTLSKADSGLIVSTAGKVVEGLKDSVEKSATVEFYPTAADAEAKSAVITPAVITTGTLLPASTTEVQATTDGKFKVTLPAVPASGKVYLRITDPAGNHIVLGIVVAP